MNPAVINPAIPNRAEAKNDQAFLPTHHIVYDIMLDKYGSSLGRFVQRESRTSRLPE
jgi:hypothetical protein